MKNKSFKLFSVLVAAFFIFSSCQIGLGEAIDLQAPEIFLTSHKDNDYVGQTFRLAGYATDNEKVKSITIDFDEANIHYKWENSTWQKKTSYIDWTALTADECACTVNNTTVTWAVTVDTTEAKQGMQSSTYSYSIVAQDQNGNSGKTSKIEGSLVVDQNTPDIKLNSPTLFATNKDIQEKIDSFELRDGSVLSQLFNGTLVFEGRQDFAAAFKEFRLELDDGTEDSNIVDSYNFNKPINSVTTENISNAYPFGRKTLYYSKTLKVGQDGIQDLRTWTVSIKPEDWISSELNAGLQSGKHQIRLVATSVSNSDAWQRKILGYFTWYPEADNPWITLYSGSESLETASRDQTYPSTKIFGVVQDDDGIESLTYSLEKQNADASWSSIKSNETLTLTETNAKNSQLSIEAPTESAIYKLSVNVKDIYGKTDSVVKYFNVLDVQPPKISLTSPTESTTVFSAGGTAIKFEGTISDDAKIKSIKIVHLNPAAANPLENKLKFINPAEQNWQKSSPDEDGNLIFDVEIPKENYDSNTKIYSYEVNKSFDLFADLKIDPDKPLITQDFVILAVDESDGATTLPISVIGDSESPKLTIDRITLNDGGISQTINIIDGIIKLPVVKPTTSATIYGTWSDNSTTHWNDISKINDIKFEWLDVNAKDFVNFEKTDDTWEVTIKQGSVPKLDGAITATLIDYANNIATISQTVTVEKAEIGLDRITCDSEDGSYNAGKELIINLEFTKSAKLIIDDENKKPYLVLNNGAKAYYFGKAEDISSGTSRHQFKYTVNEADKNISKLDVSSIESNGCSWVDANTNVGFEIQQSEISTLAGSNKTLGQRNIIIDTKAPFVNGITCISAEGYYKKDKELIFKIEFNEDVTVTNANNVKLIFDTNVTMDHVKTVKSGSKTLLSTYKVNSGNGALSITGISANDSKVEDYAGNTGNYNYEEISFSNVIIDTTPPDSPVISGFTNGAVLIDDNASVSVTITGEQGAAISYSIDNEKTWNVYNSAIELTNNGVYEIKAKQTDIAGNESLDSDVKTVTIDKGALIKKISATTFNGTYTTGTDIEGYIEFRGPVTLDNFAITLNVKNNGKAEEINEFTADENNKYNFVYTVSDGDVLYGDYLNVSAISGDVTYKGQSKTISTLPVSNLADNREIKIVTGQPEVQGVSLEGSGEDENAKLNITFDRVVSKGSGNIELAISEDDFLIPTVLTESEYNDISVKINELGTDYKPGLNGATKKNDNTLTPDTTKKYILDFAKDNNDSTLKAKFKAADLNKVVIPMYSSAVSVTESSIIVDLTGEYKLPVKGAKYSITIPAGAVKDSVGNTNVVYAPEGKLLAPGVEKPEIRIQKNGYEITDAGDLLKSDVNMPETAQMKIACQTPGSSIKYGINEISSTHVVINDCSKHETKTPDVKIPTINNDYTGTITLGSSGLTFDTAKGMKFAIAVQASTDTTTSDVAYEYAARTVLKFYIGNKYKNADDQDKGEIDDNGNFKTSIKYNGNQVHVEKLTIWIIGGDSDSGGNTIDPFPLSWGDPSNFKMMKLDPGTDNNNPITKDKKTVKGEWYWITWDISAPTYHGFVAGDVPSDAQENGPSVWYAGECFYTPLKSHYILRPGETLMMTMDSNAKNPDGENPNKESLTYDENNRASYFFRLKNKGTRPLEPDETE